MAGLRRIGEVLAVSKSKSPREFLRDRRLRGIRGRQVIAASWARVRLASRLTSWAKLLNRLLLRDWKSCKLTWNDWRVTAPMDVNSPKPRILPSEQGHDSSAMLKLKRISEIFNRMGFVTEESRWTINSIRSESLNFPKGHPARDDDIYDRRNRTLMAIVWLFGACRLGKNRVLMKYRDKSGKAKGWLPPSFLIALVWRCATNHVYRRSAYVSRRVNVGNLIAGYKKNFCRNIFGKNLTFALIHFTFRSPAEFALSCPGFVKEKSWL